MFSEDLKIGKKAEREFAKLLLDRWVSSVTFAPEWRFKDWDILTVKDGIEESYEVKADFTSASTGNVWFEYFFNNECSGVYVSKADYIVYQIDGKFYCVPRPSLLVRLEFVNKENKIWWDWKMARMFVVPKSDFFTFVNKQWRVSE